MRNEKRKSILLMMGLLALIGVFPARAELPVSLSLDAQEITREEAARSTSDEGSVLMLVRNGANSLPADRSHFSMESQREAGGNELQGPSEALMPGMRMHEQGVQKTHDMMPGHDTGAGGHMRGAEGDGKHMRSPMDGMGSHSEEMTGHMGDRGMEHSRMHETGMMGGPAGGMMSNGAARRFESMMGPGGSMMGGGAVPEIHDGDGMMGGGTGGELGGGGMHGGDDNPGPGGYGGGSMGGGE